MINQIAQWLKNSISETGKKRIIENVELTVKFNGYRVTIFKIEKVETFKAQINQEQRKNDASELINTEKFQELKLKSQLARMARQ